ncbi:Zinc finger protein CONSTANS-LIKE 13 [Hordeum vulgare]|nr:Zinc finger protein CONSTANS-LIKE 13 [Hordeum vulgare]
MARLSFPFNTRLVDLVLLEPGVVSLAMAREGNEARESLEAEFANEAYIQELHRQHPEVVHVERMIFADAAGGEVIVLCSNDEVDNSEDGGTEGVKVGGEDEEIDVDQCRSVFPNDPDDSTGPVPAHGTPYLTRKDWLDLHFDQT